MRVPIRWLYQTLRVAGVSLIKLFLVCTGSLASINAQIAELPDAAGLPEGKGAWVIDQYYHSSVINGSASATPNNTRILVQSDGRVFRRRVIQYSQLANDSGWCQDKFTDEEMRAVRNSMRTFDRNIWKDNYGPLPNSLAPFGSVNFTWRASDGKAVDQTIKLFRFDNLPTDLVALLNNVGEAGDLAFSNCQRGGSSDH
ncbi:MAG: hypothetical protein ABIR33_14205 [Pyrinomonadaceae bacterium]